MTKRGVKTLARLDRRRAVARLLAQRANTLVVTGLGASTWDAAAAGDRPTTFPLWGAMGGAALVGLGLALAQPSRRVLVVTGDGELLMGLGALATIAVQSPENFSLVVIDNERYGETGMQPSHTAHGVDLAAMAHAAGFREAVTIRAENELDAWTPRCYAETGPLFAVVKVSAAAHPLVMPPRDGTYLKHRLREHVLGRDAHR